MLVFLRAYSLGGGTCAGIEAVSGYHRDRKSKPEAHDGLHERLLA
jgi:hypothetical protein